MSETQTQTQNLLASGTIIDGRYKVLSKLGSGGFATVYKGWQLNLDQPVAIKVLNVPPGAPESFVERFYREARTAAQIRHPDVVTIFDYGVTGDGRPYIILELLEGNSVEDELRENGPMETKRLLRLFTRCLDALQAAHALGIVHRDLKPANLFLTGSGTRVETLRVLDFGIAYMLDDRETRLTGTGQFLGTPQYLAPEYIEDHSVSPALDVYQMGLILVEILTGSPVVNSDNTYQCILRHCAGKLELPPVLTSSSLGPVLKGALARSTEERFANAGVFRDALEAVDPASLPELPFKASWSKGGTGISKTSSYLPGEAEDLLRESHDSLVFKSTIDGGSNEVPRVEQESDPWLKAPHKPAANSMEAATVDPLHALPGVDPIADTMPRPKEPITSEVADIPPPIDDAPTNRGPMIAAVATAAVVLVLGVAIIAFLELSHEPEPQSPEPAPQAASDQEKETSGNADSEESKVKADAHEAAAMVKANATATSDKAAPTTTDQAPSAAVNITLTAKPDHASIFKGDELLGTGIVTIPFASAQAEAISITVRADGHVE
ncbi:MAG: protein kinase, partial [Myxococcota bacterium]